MLLYSRCLIIVLCVVIMETGDVVSLGSGPLQIDADLSVSFCIILCRELYTSFHVFVCPLCSMNISSDGFR